MVTNFSFGNFEDIIGFDDEIEFLPKVFDEFDTKIKLRQLFLNLCNNILNSKCFFSKYEQRKLSSFSLKSAFEYKIKNLLPVSCVFKSKEHNYCFSFCLNSTLIINNYLNPSKNKQFFISKKQNLLLPAKVISQCFINNKLHLLIDKNLLFHEFVLNKVKKLHKRKDVFDLGNSIFIKSKDFYGVKIYTSWKNIEVNKPDIKTELDEAIASIKKGEVYQVFLAYPKNNQFKKQIPIYVDELKDEEYQIKAIPYSLRSTIKNI